MIRNLGLCQGRHNIPQVQEYIFGQELNPLAVKDLELSAISFLDNLFSKNENNLLNLYVTGLTVALVAVINACTLLNINLVLYHFDRELNSYYPQEVVKF